jgi:hypothetical protein
MGGCTHPRLKACYIQRHNETVAAISKAIANGKKGRWLLVADLRKDVLGGLSEQQQQEVASRIPAYMLPEVDEDARKKMRPDIMFVDRLDEGSHKWDATSEGIASMKKVCKVYILEVGYCRDNAATRKRAEKKRQHRVLREALEKEGWAVQDIPLVFGHCGSVFGHELDALVQLGVEKRDALTLLGRLHAHAVRSTCNAARLYQQLRKEANLAQGRTWAKRGAAERGVPGGGGAGGWGDGRVRRPP